jgi:DNA invertase Pin-like site-specific DNA recombinase
MGLCYCGLLIAKHTSTGTIMRAALYARVSTSGQATDNQLRDLKEAASRHGWEVTAIFTDEGISGAKGREQRAGLAALMKLVARREVDIVAAWSVDRLGRSLQDLVAVLGDINAKGVDLYLHQQGLDTTTPSGRAMFQMLGVFSEFERSMIRERVNAGLARARAQGKRLGRPSNDDPKLLSEVRRLRAEGVGINRIARQLGVGTSLIQRLVPKLAD